MRGGAQRPITPQNFRQHYQSLAAKDNAGFRRELEELRGVGKELTSRAGELDANRDKNRYSNVVPYDHCRVRLSLQPTRLHSDYINASYIPGCSSDKEFICAQGPMPNTTVDFWRMVWEQDVRIIVMLTACTENGKVLCEQYWPSERVTVTYGSVQVTNLLQHHQQHCLISSMRLRHSPSPEERNLTHFFYTEWPDCGVPRDPADLTDFTEIVRVHLNRTPRYGPTAVHCSAGVGRTGCFLALLQLLQRLRLCRAEACLDVQSVVCRLRRHRHRLMVQTLEQYIFIHHCLLHTLSDSKQAATQHRMGIVQQGRAPEPPRWREGHPLPPPPHRSNMRPRPPSTHRDRDTQGDDTRERLTERNRERGGGREREM
ncbi:receptor-type tyrosine-protein phosphatase V [Amia ocellicauda]|uniref:receptor-type tyrosine-protein phosphatase V n=1 Tax=Amia ocellicauda TaxID=2972642 RepID=UPI00346467FB